MALETVERIRRRIESTTSIGGEDRQAIAALLAELEAELRQVPSTHQDDARTVAGFTEITTHEATRSTTDQSLMELAITGMRTSAEQFQRQHPRLVSVVNEIATILSRVGI